MREDLRGLHAVSIPDFVGDKIHRKKGRFILLIVALSEVRAAPKCVLGDLGIAVIGIMMLGLKWGALGCAIVL